MYFTHARTTAYTTALLSLLSSNPSLTSQIDTFLIPDFISLPSVIALTTTSSPTPTTSTASPKIIIGAQDCATHDAGAFTGEVSAAVLKEVGCGIVEVGHAERRRMFGEGDGVVRDKVAAVVRNGMWPLLCVGEVGAPKSQAAGGLGGDHGGDGHGVGVEMAAEEVVRQVTAALEGVDGAAEVVLAYEPVWAIGAAEPASAEHVKGVVRRVRESEVVRGRSGRTRIVYGGAAGPGLWGQLGGEVDGLFVGRFGHQPEQFVKMMHEVAGVSVEG
jgi:triosephosphate isomerase